MIIFYQFAINFCGALELALVVQGCSFGYVIHVDLFPFGKRHLPEAHTGAF